MRPAELPRLMQQLVESLGSAFLSEAPNAVLRALLHTGSLPAANFASQLTRAAYFLGMSAFSGACDGFPQAQPTTWQALRSEHESRLPEGANLLGKDGTPDLDDAFLRPAAIAPQLSALASGLDGARAIDLAYTYQALLELVPRVNLVSAKVCFETVGQHARRATGAYYTPPELIERVLQAALDPLLTEATSGRIGPGVESALLSFRVCDPSCGAGHFLLAAAWRIAEHLAAARASGGATARDVLPEVLDRCIYGVDVSPDAVDLCLASLWAEVKGGARGAPALRQHVRCGNALLGTLPGQVAGGVPGYAFTLLEGEDRRIATALRKELASRSELLPRLPDRERLLADAWCAAFLELHTLEAKPVTVTQRKWVELAHSESPAVEARVRELALKHRLFHWHLEFPEVFNPPSMAGFDAVIGNPPWISHSGRAAQHLPPTVQRFLSTTSPAFFGYRTTHGAFIARAAALLRLGGRLGLVVPTSVADLEGYEPVREAHDALCRVIEPLPDFGNWRFEGVCQPCMAVVSERVERGREGQGPWELERSDLTEDAVRLIVKLAALRPFSRDVFGERGMHTVVHSHRHIWRLDMPEPPYILPIREGSDVRAFWLGPVRHHANPEGLRKALRSMGLYQEVAAVVRQTARYPIAALHDGGVFRNSLLAVFERKLPASTMVALLNSSLIRWLHYHRFRDARQGMPQVKIGHLRSIPAPPESADAIAPLGRELCARNTGITRAEQATLDGLVFDIYRLEAGERAIVSAWSEDMPK